MRAMQDNVMLKEVIITDTFKIKDGKCQILY